MSNRKQSSRAIFCTILIIGSILTPLAASPVVETTAAVNPDLFIDGDATDPSLNEDLNAGQTYTFDIVVEYQLPDGESDEIQIAFPDAGGVAATKDVTGTGSDERTTITVTKTVPKDLIGEPLRFNAIFTGDHFDADEEEYSIVAPGDPPEIQDTSPPTENTVVVEKGGTRSFSVSALDPDNDDLTYTWYLKNLPGDYEQVASGPSNTYSHTFDGSLEDGEAAYELKVEVADKYHVVSTDWLIDVGPENQDRSPSINRVSPSSQDIPINSGDTKQFEVEVSDPDTDYEKLVWSVDGSLVDTRTNFPGESSFTDSFEYTFETDESHTIRAEIIDSNGNSASLSWGTKQPDLRVTGLESSPVSPNQGETVSFNVTISNRGEAAAKNVNYVIKNNDTGDFIANPPTVTLDPGEAHTARLIGEFTIQEPPVNVTAIVDPGNDIQETYENNNKRDLRIGSQRQVSLSEISFTIQKVNGEDRGSDVVPVEDAFVKSLTVKAVGPEGRPLSGLSLRLNNAIQSKEGISVTEVDPGSYKFSGSPALGSVMTIQKYDIYLANDGTENSKTLQLPVRDPGLPLPGPIEGWGALQSVTVSVEGNTYTAVNMFQWTSESKDSSYGWVVYDSSDNLVTDPQIQKKAGKTAVVSLLTNHYEKRWEEFLGEDYPKNIDEFLMADFVLQGSVAVRDASAYTLGTITAIQTSGGTSRAGTQTISRLSTKQAVTLTGRTVLRESLKNLAKDYTAEQVKENPKATMEAAIRETARVELLASKTQAENAAQALEDHPDDEVWQYRDAKDVWIGMNESVVDGNVWMALRANSAPGGPVWEQTPSVLAEFASGYSGVPASTVGDLTAAFVTQSDLGIQQSMRETAGIRQSAHRDYQSFSEVGPALSDTIEQKYGTSSGEIRDTTQQKHASIELIDPPEGTYNTGDTVSATVRVTNTGDRAEKFFVGYSVGATVQGKLNYYDNRDQTGRFVSLTPGQSKTLDVEWTATQYAPTGKTYDVVVAIWENFPSSDTARLDSVTQSDSFTLTTGGSISITDVSVPDSATAFDQVPITVQIRNTGTAIDHKEVQIVENGEVILGELAYVGADQTRDLTITTTFSESGTHVLTVAGESVSIDITAPPEPPKASIATPEKVDAGTTVTLDASDSTDPDGDDSELTYDWSVVSAPSGASVSLPSGPTGDITLSTAGSYKFKVTVIDAQDETDTAAVIVTVEPGPDPVGDFQNAPTDPDNDGTYEDVNGDGSINVGDAQAIFANTNDPVVENNIGAFDFNDDGSVNVGDAQALFATGQEA